MTFSMAAPEGTNTDLRSQGFELPIAGNIQTHSLPRLSSRRLSKYVIPEGLAIYT